MKATLPITLIALFVLLLHSPLQAETYNGKQLAEAPVIEAKDLAADSAAARGRQVIMLMVSQEHCPFCEYIKRDVIRPMIRGEDFKGELMIRELLIDPGVMVVDFNGRKRRGIDLASDYNASLTPTLLFLSPQGDELSKKIIGYTTPDLFYYYVEESIKNALVALKSNGK